MLRFLIKGTDDHFMEIKSSATNITISDMTIQDYNEGANGGAIAITTTGTVTIQDVNFHNNSSTEDGGAIYTAASTNVTIDR